MKKYNLRVYEVVLYALAVALTCILTYFTLMLFMQIVFNYAALTLSLLAPIPLIAICTAIITLLIYAYRYRIKGATDPYTRRLYAIIVMALSFVGMASAIFTGLGIYGSFVGDAIFVAYPLITLIASALLFAAATLALINAIQNIGSEKPEKPVYEHKHFHRWATVGFSFFILIGFSRFGSILLLPILVSPVNGIYAIPFYIWSSFPLAMLVFYLIARDFMEKEKREKFVVISNLSFLLLSVVGAVFTYALASNHQPEVIAALSNFVYFERITAIPIDFFVLSLLTMVPPLITLIKLFVIKIRKAK